MECESFMATIALLGILVLNGVVCESSVEMDSGLHSTLVKKLDRIQRQLEEVTNSVKSLDNDIGQAMLVCPDIYSSLCRELQSGAVLRNDGDLTSVLGLGKRSVLKKRQASRLRGYYSELSRKREMIDHLLGVLQGAGNVLKTERKRTCQVNLGFHCDTEEIHKFADQYDFLASDKSPGKRKRAVSESS